MRLAETVDDVRRRDATERFAPYRPALSGLAFSLLGDVGESDACLERTREWLAELQPPGARIGEWLVLALARECLETMRREAGARSRPAWSLPDFVVTVEPAYGARQHALLAGGVGTGLFAALHALSPEERVALVLHDTYGTPYEDLAADVLCCSTTDVEHLVERARVAVDGVPVPDLALARQHATVHAFFRAAQAGHHDAVAALLRDGFRLQSDSGDHVLSGIARNVDAVVQRAVLLSRTLTRVHPALINGAAGVVVSQDGRTVALVSFTVVDGLIARIDALADHSRIIRTDIPGLDLPQSAAA